MKAVLQGAAIAAVLMLLSACVLSRSVVTLSDATASDIPADSVAPAGPAVKIVEVTDQRTFQVDPKAAQTPSLKDDNIDDKSITERAIARKRNGWGQAAGDVLLPEGDSVASHLRLAVANGFREAGYRVLSPGDAGYDQAIPVKVEIDKFWSWLSIGFAANYPLSEASIKLDAPLPAFAPSPIISTSTRGGGDPLLTDSSWQSIAEQNLASVTTKVTALLKADKTSTQSGSAN